MDHVLEFAWSQQREVREKQRTGLDVLRFNDLNSESIQTWISGRREASG